MMVDPKPSRDRTVFRLGLILQIIAIIVLLASPAMAQETSERAASILLVDIDGPIGPATADHVGRAIDTAAEADTELLILRIDTPGGLATAMRDIIADILASEVPIASYVAPEGARAASAGTYILYASHIAAMAPATNLGAATPVSIGGGLPGGGQAPAPGDDPGSGQGNGDEAGAPPADARSAKAINDSVAYIRGLAERRDRNAEWAEKAVREAASLNAGDALDQQVIDLIAPDLAGLLASVDGMEVTAAGANRTLATTGAAIESIERSLVTKILEILSNPNVALLLVTLGFYGLVFELANPGLGPGVVGAICLLLGLYGLNQLPLDYTGLALLGLGLAFMTVEALSPSFGAFGIGGAVAFGLGAWILVDTDIPAYQISPWLIVTLTILSAASLALVFGIVWRAQRRRARTGESALIGAEARVIDWNDGGGHVGCLGERWRAVGPETLDTGDPARVVGIDGLTLTITPAETATAGTSQSQEKQ